MPCGCVVVHSCDCALQKSPHALDGVGVNIAANELLGFMPHGLVLVAQAFHTRMSAVLVGVDHAAVLHVSRN